MLHWAGHHRSGSIEDTDLRTRSFSGFGTMKSVECNMRTSVAPVHGQPHRSGFMHFTSLAKTNYESRITFKSISSRYKVFPGSIAMVFIFEFAIIG